MLHDLMPLQGVCRHFGKGAWRASTPPGDTPPSQDIQEGGMEEDTFVQVPMHGQEGWVVWDGNNSEWMVEKVRVSEEGQECAGKAGKSRVCRTGVGGQDEW